MNKTFTQIVFVIDCREPDTKNLIDGLHTSTITNFNRVYKNASITVIRLPSLLIKGLNRATYFLACHRIIKKIVQLEHKRWIIGSSLIALILLLPIIFLFSNIFEIEQTAFVYLWK